MRLAIQNGRIIDPSSARDRIGGGEVRAMKVSHQNWPVSRAARNTPALLKGLRTTIQAELLLMNAIVGSQPVFSVTAMC